MPLSGCLSGTSITAGCGNTTSLNVGFDTTPPTGSRSNPFGGISAGAIINNGDTAHPDVVPNGAVGLKQYMMFADGYVQAYTKSGTNAHEAIFANTNGGAAHPQPANSPWETDGRDSLGPYCGNEGVDFNLDYDHVNTPPGQGTPGLWVLSGAANPTIGTTLHRVLCIASSAQDDLYNNDGNSYWSAYAFDLTGSVTPAIFMPSHSSVYDLADYPRFGNWVDGYYMTFDFINVGTDAIEGFAVCKLDSADISQGNEANSATCYAYLPTATPPMIHTLLPADMQSDSYPTGTAGEFFLATVNPGSDGNPCTTITPPCTSNTLAFWTWAWHHERHYEPDHSYEYQRKHLYAWVLQPRQSRGYSLRARQPGGTMNIVDSVGDLLISLLATSSWSAASTSATVRVHLSSRPRGSSAVHADNPGGRHLRQRTGSSLLHDRGSKHRALVLHTAADFS